MADAEQAPIPNQPETENMIPPFPFSPHILREGEPPYPTHQEKTEAEYEVLKCWIEWAWQQPDHPILITDYHQRSHWEFLQGDIMQNFARDWIYERRAAAAQSRTEYLSQYWSNNDEFQMYKPSDVFKKVDEIMEIARTSPRSIRRRQR